MKIVLIATCIFIPSLCFADRFENIMSGADIAFSTNTVSAGVMHSSDSVSYVGVSSLTATNGILTLSSSSVSYLGISSASVDSLTKSSAALAYVGISSLTATNGILTLSSAAVSYTAISTDALKITYSSAAVAYLGISSASVDSLTKSSAALAYVGISSLTSSNGVLTLSSAAVAYLGISSTTALPVTAMTYSSAAVAYLGISSLTASNGVLTLSSAAASYLAISTVGAVTSIYSPYGTGYTFTATTGTLNVAGSSITITIGTAGTYLLLGETNLTYNAATFAANQTVTLAIYRQNNTPGVVANSPIQLGTRIITSITDDAGYYATPLLVYTTANTNDQLSFHGSITVVPSAGSFQAKRASLMAIRLH